MNDLPLHPIAVADKNRGIFYKFVILPLIIAASPFLILFRVIAMGVLIYFFGAIFWLIDKDYPKHVSDKRRAVIEFVDRCMGRSLLLVQGLVLVVKNDHYFKNARVIIGNHYGMNDVLTSAAAFPGIPVSKQGFAELWPFYQVAKANRAFLTKRGKVSRKVSKICPDSSITDRMVKHLQESKIPIGIFPEGTIGRREFLLRFKTSVFRLGVPITPVTIKYITLFENRWQLQKWYVMVFQLLANPCGLIEVEFHPPMSALLNEEPQAFADRVGRFMAERLSIQYVDYGQADKIYFKEGGKAAATTPKYRKDFGWMGRWREFAKANKVDHRFGLFDSQVSSALRNGYDATEEVEQLDDSAITSVTMVQ